MNPPPRHRRPAVARPVEIMFKLILNVILAFVVITFARRVITGWLKPKSGRERPESAPRREDSADLGQGQKIEEADYEDLP